MARGGETQRRASVPEIVGAWLHIWTPPRDAVVPPVPWRKLAVWGGAGLVALGAVLALAIPRIDAANDRRAAREAARLRQSRLAEHDRVVAAQRPHHGELAGARDRARLLGAVEASILADARARARAGAIRPVRGPSTCERTPGTAAAGRYGVLDCFVVARHIVASSGNVAGDVGYPFRAVVDFRRSTYTWCMVEAIPGELNIPDPATVVRLPPECRPPDQS